MSPRTAVAPAREGAVDLAALGAAPRPQVNLLPPDVRSRRALGRTKIRLLALLAVVFLVGAGGIAFAWLAERGAAADLVEAEAEVERLTAEQAQYAEIPQIKGEIARIEEARRQGTQTEVLWRPYLEAIRAVTPQGVTIQSFETEMPAPGTGAPVPANPLATNAVGTLTFTARGTSLLDVAAWIDGIESVPGFADATFTSAQRTGAEGEVFYDYSGTVQVDATLFAFRFVEDGVQ